MRRLGTAGRWLLCLLLGAILVAAASAQVPLDPRVLAKYVDSVPVPGVMPPVAANYYEVGMYQIQQQLHSQLPPTTVWAYGTSAATAGYPGATFEVTRGQPIQVKWINDLWGVQHPLPVDQTLHWADPLNLGHVFLPYLGPIPTVTHVHGAEVEPQSDGGPDSWFTPGFGITGSGWQKEVYYYDNEQPPTTLWYHDHALGITRLNVYMGLAGFYLVRDPVAEASLNLPSGAYEIPLVIQDRLFDINGQFVYPVMPTNPTVNPYWGPEFFGDTILVNGKVWPRLKVEPRKYRFRFLNGSNARFYSMQLIDPVTMTPGPAFWQIGTDGGYLQTPVMLNDPLNPASPRLTFGPGERADVVIDFTGITPGTVFILDNSARSPFPKGGPPDPQTTRQIMLFEVVPLTDPDTSTLPATLNWIPDLTTLAPIAQVRTLTLNELMGPGGPLAMFLDGKMWDDAATETPVLGTTEIWQIVNLTADTHPIHLHLAQFQLLSRQKFQLNKYLKEYNKLNPVIPAPVTVNPPIANYTQGPVMPPALNEFGWKDTVQMNSGEVTTIVVRWAPIGDTAVTLYPFDATAEPGYVWHCHILEHEDNEMMRPLRPVAPAP